MTTPDLSRKVRQLDNDVQAVYEMLARIEATQQRHGNRLDELATAVDQLAPAVGQLSTGVDQLSTGVDQLSTGVDQLSTGVDQLSSTQTAQGTKLDRIIDLLESR
jgi:X-X-X-Leu-X-X-Gly heptad repeat protein